MITNAGLNEVATNEMASFSDPFVEENMKGFQPFLFYAHVGTGTTPPSEFDTMLEAEVNQSSEVGSNITFATVERDAAGGMFSVTQRIPRVFGVLSADSLTEYGFTSMNGWETVVRGLFLLDPEDPNSSPVSIDVQPGDELHLMLDFTVAVPWEEPTAASFDLAGVGLIEGTAGWFASPAADGIEAAEMFWQQVWPGNFNWGGGMLMAALLDDNFLHDRGSGVDTLTSGDVSDLNDNEGYVFDSHELTHVGTFSGPLAVGNNYGVVMAPADDGGGNIVAGFRFAFDNPSSFVKSFEENLTYAFTVQWGRF